MSKQEATRLADALRQSFPAFGDGTRSDRERLAVDAAALLERWPDAVEPVARVSWNDIGHISWRTNVMLPDGTPLYTAPPDQSERIAALEAENANLVRGLREATEPPTFMGEPVPDARIAALARLAAYQEAREVAWEAELKDSQSVAEHWKAKHAAGNARIAALEAALGKIDAIRNSIIGAQKVNWSEHIYPLVAALEGAGYHGQEYEVARENLGTLLARIAALEASLAERDRVIEQARVALERIRHATAPTHDDGGHHEAAHDLSIDALRAIEEVRK